MLVLAFIVVAVASFIGGVYAHKAVAAEAAKVSTVIDKVKTDVKL